MNDIKSFKALNLAKYKNLAMYHFGYLGLNIDLID